MGRAAEDFLTSGFHYHQLFPCRHSLKRQLFEGKPIRSFIAATWELLPRLRSERSLCLGIWALQAPRLHLMTCQQAGHTMCFMAKHSRHMVLHSMMSLLQEALVRRASHEL